MSNKIVDIKDIKAKQKEQLFSKDKLQTTYTVDTGATLYDANKQIISQLIEKGDMIPLTPMEEIPIQRKIEDWFNMECDSYAMLLCHELRDYTVFSMYRKENSNPPREAAKELMLLLHERGTIYSIEEERRTWEIWIKNEEDNNLHVYYLFRYDEAVIEV